MIKEFLAERTAGFASASRVSEIEMELLAQNRELLTRLATAEKRLAQCDVRFDGQVRHLRNLEAKVSGVGTVEHSPRNVEAKP